jgi:hypothetical protein
LEGLCHRTATDLDQMLPTYMAKQGDPEPSGDQRGLGIEISCAVSLA